MRRDTAEVPPDAITVRPPDPVLPPVDVEVTLPFGTSAVVPITIDVSFANLDLVLNIDTTGSFDEEIDQLQSSFISTILPELRRSVSGIAIGVTKFQDYNFGSFGGMNDVPYRLLSPVTTDFTMTSAAIARLDEPIGGGGDLPESGYESLYQIASGMGQVTEGETLIRPWSETMRAPGGGREAGVGFREHSVRAVIHATDATSHEGGDYGINSHSSAEATTALIARNIRVIGVVTQDEPDARRQLEALALATGAVVAPGATGQCQTGLRGTLRSPRDGVCPLVFDIDAHGGGLNEVVVQSIEDLLRSVTYREAHGVALDDRYGLIQAIAATGADVTPPSRAPRRTDEFPTDGVIDTFRDIDHGITLHFEVRLQNDVLIADDYDRRVTLNVAILGDGVVVAMRAIRVVIPRRVPMDAGPHDAGRTDAGVDSSAPDVLVLDAGPDAFEQDAFEQDVAIENDAPLENDASLDDAGIDAAD